MNKLKIINEIKAFLDGYNDDLKYLVHVEASPNESYAECIIHPPNGEKEIVKVDYTPFLYTKDFSKQKNLVFYHGDEELIKEKMIQYGIKREKLKTGNQKRLEEGYCWKYTSYKSYNDIVYFFRDGGIYPYEKARDDEGKIIKNFRGDAHFLYRDLFFAPKPYEQFLIDKRARLFKGFEEYKEVHKLTLDIETTGLRPEISRVFAIGIRDNRGFEIALKVEKEHDDEAEAKMIQDMFNVINFIKPAVILGHNSEDFDFYYLLGRASILKMDLDKIQTTLRPDHKLKRIPNSSVKIGDSAEKYTATQMWGYTVIDTLHAAKKTAKLNTDMKGTGLKYICKFEEIAKENRTYIPGEDGDIGRYFHENPMFIGNDNNEHLEIPNKFKDVAETLLKAQIIKDKFTEEQYREYKNTILNKNPDFVAWFRLEAAPKKFYKFISGKKLLEQYLLDDLWETEQVDELYNQSSFMLAKIVPTTYGRICTMGTASIWNLLLTAWSFEKGLAIPIPDTKKKFSGGLSRCYKRGYVKRLVKIDYASLYPMLQLTWDIFPIFDISGVMKMMLIYMTTTRNIYKKLASSAPLNEEEVELMKEIDHETYVKYINDALTSKERAAFKVKQLPIKILNNSQFGALGSDISFNWSDNECAARITCCGRIELRHAIKWFEQFDCIPLYAVTDGVNFQVPDKTTIRLTPDGVFTYDQPEGVIEDMWIFGNDKKGNDIVGINALIEYFNVHEMKPPFMAVDNDGEFLSCFNLARINYAVLEEKKDKKSGEMKKKVKLTGNTIKSSTMSEYIEEFMGNGWNMILEGKGAEFVDYYYDYAQEIYYKQIPLKKIATKKKYKDTIKQYVNRGTDKNGKPLAKRAHMELVIAQRNKIAEELFEKYKDQLEFKDEEKLTIEDKLKLVDVYMPPEPELDSTLYYYNTGYRKSHGDSDMVKDAETGELRPAATLIGKQQMIDNPELTGDYNKDKYLAAFNSRVKNLFHAFDPEVAKKIPAKITRKKVKDADGNKVEEETLVMGQFARHELELKAFDLDDVHESMFLEEKEVEFWNEYGYDPRLVWDGFEMHDDMKVHYEIYEDALNYLNKQMKDSGKSIKIKSRNEQINKNDLVLYKNGPVYSVGRHNGQFIEIIREDVKVPKSEVELKLDQETKRKEEEIKKLDTGIDLQSELEKKHIKLEAKRLDAFPEFKKRFNLPNELDYDTFISDAGQDGYNFIDSFIEGEQNKVEDENAEYLEGYD